MKRMGRYAIAAAVAATAGALFPGGARAQVIDGTQGDATVPLLSDVPQGLNGSLTVRRFSSNDTTVCCELAAYANERPDATINLINSPAKWSNVPATDTVVRPVLNISDGGTVGHFGQDSPPPNSPAGTDINNWASYTRGTIRIPTAGQYTFDVNSDDSFILAFPDAAGGSRPWDSFAGQGGTKLIGFRTNASAAFTPSGGLTFPVGRGANDSFGTITLPAGDHPFVLIHEDGNGGGNIELSAAPGAKTAFDNSFLLVGSPARTVTSGFGGTVAPFEFSRYDNVMGGVNNILAAYAANPQGNTHATVPTINYQDPQNPNTGGHTPVATMPGDTANDEENYGAVAKTTLTISAAQAGIKTFVLYTDDGYSLVIRNAAGQPVSLTTTGMPNQGTVEDTNADGEPDALRHNTDCCTDRVGHWNLAAGTYTVEAAFHEIGGGSGFFLYAADGDKAAFDDSFVLLGAAGGTTNFPAGLQLVPEPGTLSLFGLGALGLLARRRRRTA